MDMEQFTHLGRPVDLTYPTNQAIVVISVSTLIIATMRGILTHSLLLTDGLLQGAQLGGAVFLAWAIARETDPDGEILAFFVIPPTLLLIYWLGPPDFGLLFLLLLIMRVVNRTIGLTAKPVDVLVLLLLTYWLAYDGAWYITFCVAIAFALDSFMVQPHPSHRWVAILLAIGTMVLFYTTEGLYNPTLSAFSLWLVIAGILGTIAMLLFTPQIQSKSDNGRLIHLQRLQATWLLTLLLALLTVCFNSNGFTTLSPVWAVLIVLGTYRFVLWIINP